ncbi:glutathione S-transferase family protein [Pseudorhodobacter sp.]|uniref:glutathione S-transferase family protein n=1 Tax=Pseudorhodobacter sp. TaxID=1934400 RepID=UPI002647F3A9|nr:glutathione S-transferase family protein [Pseudorhodobacter sp.]MDN5786219.1 glutathione S-transferase family protein [Pseudorhodobacter sp.]
MLTLYHAAPSRSSRIITLIDEMGIGDKITVKHVTIPRQDGSGQRDPSNPHPEGKVPCLDHDGTLISETGAVMLYLLDMFPTDLAPKIGEADRGAFLTWMYWYGSVMEPVLIHTYIGADYPALMATFRDHAAVIARIHAALEKGPWLLGDRYSAADLLVHSPYVWFAQMMPDDPLIVDWVARCAARPANQRTKALDAA